MAKLLILSIVPKLIFGFIVILVIIRLLEKRNLSQLTPGDIIYFMVFGGILEESLYDNKVKFWHVLLALIIWGLIIYLFELIISKSRIARKWFRGDTDILISNGEISQKCLKNNKLEIDQILSIAREKNIFDLSDIKNMYIESDGGFTIEPYTYQYPLIENAYTIYPLIENETINKQNLKKINKDETWLYKQLAREEVYKIKDVFYADWSEYRGMYILKLFY